MFKKVLALFLVLVVCSAAQAVVANWSEEMNGAIGPEWSVTNIYGAANGYAADFISTTIDGQGVWYDYPNRTHDGEIVPNTVWNKMGARASLGGDNSPLKNRDSYTLDVRFKFTVGSPTQDPAHIVPMEWGDHDGYFDDTTTEPVRWYFYPGIWGGGAGDAYNNSMCIRNESPGTQTWSLKFGQRWATSIGDITAEASSGSTLPGGNFTQNIWDGTHAPYNTPVGGDWVTARIICDAANGTLGMYLNGELVYGFEYLGPRTNDFDNVLWIGKEDGGSYPIAYDYIRVYNGVLDEFTPIDAVPEPVTLTLLGLGGLALIRRKR